MGRRVSQCSVAVGSAPTCSPLYSKRQCSVAAAMSFPHHHRGCRRRHQRHCCHHRITTISRIIIITATIVTISIVICDYPAPAHRSCNPLKLLHLFALPSSTPVQMQSPWQASSDAAATEHTGEPQLAGWRCYRTRSFQMVAVSLKSWK